MAYRIKLHIGTLDTEEIVLDPKSEGDNSKMIQFDIIATFDLAKLGSGRVNSLLRYAQHSFDDQSAEVPDWMIEVIAEVTKMNEVTASIYDLKPDGYQRVFIQDVLNKVTRTKDGFEDNLIAIPLPFIINAITHDSGLQDPKYRRIEVVLPSLGVFNNSTYWDPQKEPVYGLFEAHR